MIKTEDKAEERPGKAKGKNEDFPMVKWHAEGQFVLDQHNNFVCECYDLRYRDVEAGRAWADHNAATIAFLHNVRLEKDKIISQAKSTSKEETKK